MRLIDADELIKYIKIWEIGTSISSDQKEFIDCINRQPTALDVNEVVERLKKLPKYSTWNHNSDNVNREKVIDIVKGGGVE